MIAIVHRLLKSCEAKDASRIRLSYIFAFLKSFVQNAPFMAAVFVIREIIEGRLSLITCIVSAAVMFLCLILAAVFQHISDRLQSSSGYKIFAGKRIDLARHLRSLPMGYFTAGNIGRISSILSEDIVFVEENSMSVIAEIVSGLFSQLVLTGFLFVMHPLIGCIALLTAVVALIVSVPMNRQNHKNSLARQEAVEDLTGSVIEYIEGMAVAKSFGLTGERGEFLRKSFEKSRETNLRFEREYAPWEKAMETVYLTGIAGILTALIVLSGKGSIDTAGFIGVLLFLLNLFVPFKRVFQLANRLTIMDIAMKRIESVMSEEPLPDDGDKIPDAGYEHEIEFEDVSFSYESENVLEGISFTADKGSMVALVGQSGSGKTTIANLLARFWDIGSGSIRLRGIDIRDMSIETLMSHISMVFQKVYLFEDTVFNNIAMGKEDATYEEVAEAARKARCYDFVMNLPYGFDTVIGEGGAALSGGEAQRISIARCILKDAPIVILDEATASIDADNERYIREAMYELCIDKTVLVIAHRLNTIRGADEIIVLDQGRICERGDHASLMEKKGVYHHMVSLQDQRSEVRDK